MNRREMLKGVGIGVVGLIGLGGAAARVLASESKRLTPLQCKHRQMAFSHPQLLAKMAEYPDKIFKETLAKFESVLFVYGPWHGQIRKWCTHLDKLYVGTVGEHGPWPCYVRSLSNPAYALEESFSRVLQRPPDSSVCQVYHAQGMVHENGEYKQWAEYWKIPDFNEHGYIVL